MEIGIVLQVIIYILTAVFTLVTILLIIDGSKKKRSYIVGTATIINIEKQSDAMSEANTMRIVPIVRYEVEGIEYIKNLNYSTTAMKVGDTVDILYDKCEPSKMTSKTATWLMPLIFGSVTAVLFIASVILTVISIICW